MIKTSGLYNPFPVVRDVDCRISFGVVDQAAKDAEITASGATGSPIAGKAYLGSLDQTSDSILEIGGKWASLENNFWALDGTYDIAPDSFDGVETGWWSYLVSGADDGVFSLSGICIQYVFSSALSTLGWTLRFDRRTNQYPVDVVIEVLGEDGSVIETLQYYPDSAIQVFRHYVGDYYGARFIFKKTSEPGRRLRLIETEFGVTQYYDRDSLGTVSIVYGASLDMKSLPARELVFTFDNSLKDYNLLNPDGVYQYLQDGQLINAKMVIGGEEVDMGDFYFTKADASVSAIAPQITAHDRIYALDSVEFNGGRDEQVNLSAAIAEVLSGSGIPVVYGDGIAARKVQMTIPVETKKREAVRLLAQAARCVAYIARDGKLHFEDFVLADSPDGLITADELYDYSGVGIADRVYGLRLCVADDFRVGSDGEPGRRVYFTCGDADRSVLYSNPCVADSEGQAVADWLFSVCKMYKHYSVKNRCDPAVEIGDTLNIADAYQNEENAVVVGLNISFGNGSLSAVTEAVGE